MNGVKEGGEKIGVEMGVVKEWVTARCLMVVGNFVGRVEDDLCPSIQIVR